MSRRAACLLLLAACSGVEIPEDQLYRLAAPAPGPVAQMIAGVLRVERPQIAAELQGDALMVAEGPVRLAPYRFHRWAAPLEALLGDALVVALQRARSFEQVLGADDTGAADLVLHTRVLACHQDEQTGEWRGELRLALWLADRDGRVVFQRELGASVPAGARNPEAVVFALSRALGAVVDGLLDATQYALTRGALSPAPPR